MNVNIKLQIFKMKEASRSETSLAQRYRCAVVDLDKPEKYPSNFVCMLPAQIGSDKQSAFFKLFGDKSVELAGQLLTDALETETDIGTKAEIGRRLKIIKSSSTNQVECSVCGKMFKPTRRSGFRQRLCPECKNKIFVHDVN